jgi:hypothetical protein
MNRNTAVMPKLKQTLLSFPTSRTPTKKRKERDESISSRKSSTKKKTKKRHTPLGESDSGSDCSSPLNRQLPKQFFIPSPAPKKFTGVVFPLISSSDSEPILKPVGFGAILPRQPLQKLVITEKEIVGTCRHCSQTFSLRASNRRVELYEQCNGDDIAARRAIESFCRLHTAIRKALADKEHASYPRELNVKVIKARTTALKEVIFQIIAGKLDSPLHCEFMKTFQSSGSKMFSMLLVFN